MTSVSLNAAIEELEHSCLVASMCLLASLPANMEKVLARQAAFLGAVADGLDPVGRTFRAPGGYIQILAEHGGRWQRDLPDGLDRDGSPLLDLLRSLISALRPLVARRDGDPAARTSFDQVPDACSADYDQRLLTAFRETLKPLTGYHAALAAGDKEIAQVYIRTATKAFGEISEMTSQLRDALAMDGHITAAEMALCDIGCRLAGREPSAAPGANLTPTALLLSRYIDALVRTRAVTAPAYLAEVCFEMVTAGQEKVLREVAHAYSSQARQRMRAAVDAPSMQQFQVALFSALPYELGALFIASAARDSVAAAGRAPWAALAGHAEEWAVRMQTSFGLAAQILQDGRIFEAHRRYFDGIRAAEGEQAAQSKAAEFVEQRIYYPRVTLPLLLSAEPIPARAPLRIDSWAKDSRRTLTMEQDRAISSAQDMQRATAAIGRELAWDLTYLAPAEERHFDPVSVAEGAAAFLMMAYLRGFIDQISGRAAKLGERTADFLLDRIGALFRGDPPPTPDELSAVADQARDAAGKDQEGTAKAVTATEAHIFGYLLSRHMPEDTARAIAAMVRTLSETEPDHLTVRPGRGQSEGS